MAISSCKRWAISNIGKQKKKGIYFAFVHIDFNSCLWSINYSTYCKKSK